MHGQEQHVGDNSVAIQVAGDNIVIAVGTLSLTLARRHLLKASPRNERELLITEIRGTDLVGRDADLAALNAWLRAPHDLPAVRCLTGRAGAGKTRLAIELCEQAEASGWTAGFAILAELQRFHDTRSLEDWRWGKPTLIVVDYAAASARMLRAWLEALARRRPAPDEAPLRLLLLERHADRQVGWWADLIRPGGLSGRGPDELASPAEPVPLPPLDSPADRRALLRQVVGRTAGFVGKAVPDIPPEGADADFDRRLSDVLLETEPLFLVMAGIVGMTTGVPQALALGRTDLAMRIAESERVRLGRLSVGWGIDADASATMVAHLAACITLQGGCDRKAVIALIRQEGEAMGWRLAKPPDWIAARLAEALHRPQGGVDAIRPDIVGEAFLLRQLAVDDRPVDEQAAIVGRARDRDAASVLGSMIRTVQDFAGERGDHPALGWLDHLIAATDDLPALIEIADSIPVQTLALRERAAHVQNLVVRRLQTSAGDSPDLRAERAKALNNLSIRLSAVGRLEDALAAVEEAVPLFRTLAAQYPDMSRDYLAGSLRNLAARLGQLGRLDDALAPAEEAVQICRGLVAQHRDAFKPDLARSLQNLAIVLGRLDRRRDALVAIEEAILLWQALNAQSPDDFRSDLAAGLTVLAAGLSGLGRQEHALSAAEGAASLYRILAAQSPDAFQPYLVTALVGLASSLQKLDRLEDALPVQEEAVALYRSMASRRPEAFDQHLAGSLGALVPILQELGRPVGTLRAATEAVARHRALGAQRPETFLPDLAISLNGLASALNRLGLQEQALAAVEETVSIYRSLTVRYPDTYHPDLAKSLAGLATVLSALGRREAALAAAWEAVSLCRMLDMQQPDVFQPELASSLDNLATRLSEFGKAEEALAPANEAVSLYRTLAARQSNAFRPEMTGSLHNLANRLSETGHMEDAISVWQEAVSIGRMLAARRLHVFGPKLALPLAGLVRGLCAVGRWEEAVTALQEGVSLYRMLADRHPGAFRPLLVAWLHELAECLGTLERREEALMADAEAIALLAEPFSSLPGSLAIVTCEIAQAYVQRCRELGRMPDIALLLPNVAMQPVSAFTGEAAMSVELQTAWTVATHVAELVAAHGLVEAGKAPARKALAWLRDHLPEADQPTLVEVVQNPSAGPARAALTLQINTLLEANPNLLTEIRALLAESKGDDSSQHQTVGDNSTAYQIRGDNISITR